VIVIKPQTPNHGKGGRLEALLKGLFPLPSEVKITLNDAALRLEILNSTAPVIFSFTELHAE